MYYFKNITLHALSVSIVLTSQVIYSIISYYLIISIKNYLKIIFLFESGYSLKEKSLKYESK